MATAPSSRAASALPVVPNMTREKTDDVTPERIEYLVRP
jgi:hypothetical protein